MPPTMILVVYCVLILAASLAGGWIPFLVRLTHRRMELAVSLVAGVMLGVGILHMLPHAFLERAEALGDAAGGMMKVDHESAHAIMGPLMLWLLGGFLVMFFIERFFCFHHHDPPQPETGAEAAEHDHAGCGHDHGHGRQHGHNHDHGHDHGASDRHRLTWTGAAIGLSLHTLIEGIALAASVEVAREHSERAALVGLGTFLVILLHKPFDSLTLGTLMHLGERSTGLRHLVNIAFGLLVPVGVGLFHLGLAGQADRGLWVSAALAFSAGTFLCIASSDLLPELQFHQHDRVKLSLMFLAGLAIAWAIGLLESGVHEH